jgi:hypothetical protein
MQLQGEIQELAIEEWLKNQFVLDTIEEIKKVPEERIVFKQYIQRNTKLWNHIL